MRVLIRFLARSAGGAVETRERVFEGDSVTLGRGTDQVLHLKDARVALEHARIFRSGQRILIACRQPAQVLVNGLPCRDAALAAGDIVQIGSNTLRMLAPGDGFDLSFTFELDPTADSRQAASEAPRLELQALGLRKRGWAWALFLGTLTFGLVVPWAASRVDEGNAQLRTLGLPSERAWSTGPLHRSHANLEGDCGACHQQPFVRVRDAACLTCHRSNLHRHADRATAMQGQCTDCHAEHEEPARLVQTDQRLCAQCHGLQGATGGDLAALGAEDARAPIATDFAADHPDFDVTLERSGLEFPHHLHLDPAGVDTPDGTAIMQCADCHVPEPGGARFQPVRMQTHCASCHRLDFDPTAPEATVPHGDPAEVLRALVEHYSARYLAGYPDALRGAPPVRASALPALDLPRADRERLLGAARTRAALTARDLFERRACVTCHEVARDGEGASATWTVEAVELRRAWMPGARFSHASHATTLTPCATCHAAAESKHAADVLMPRIEACRACHGGEPHQASRDSRIAGTCTTCHAFHRPDTELWVPKP